jgi:GT2 family glycosyltransferase
MMLYAGWTPLQDACYWRRSIYNRIGGINPALRYAGDYDFFLRASLLGKCVYAPKIYSAFRRHENQKSISTSDHYEREREECRRRMLRELHVSVPQRLGSEIVFGLMARWRYYVGRRLYRSGIPGGTAASELVVA